MDKNRAIPKGHYTFAVFKEGEWQFPIKIYRTIAECKKHAKKHGAVVLWVEYRQVE